MKNKTKDKMSILNLCGGKIIPEISNEQFLINLDQIYFEPDSIPFARGQHMVYLQNYNFIKNRLYINHDVYDFLERYDIPFDKIIIYRFLEHVPKSNVLYFIYLLSTITKPGAILDVIVPDYTLLAQRILDEDPFRTGFEGEDIITTYELLNDLPSPHLSVWTNARLVYFFNLEKRFCVKSIENKYEFDGRNIYIRALIERV